MSYKIVQSITPGQSYTLPLQLGITTKAVDVANGTPFDLDYRGFGVSDTIVVPAGLIWRFYEGISNEGGIHLLGVNNNQVPGTGVVNITVYNTGDKVPEGKFPAFIPVQTVQAKVATTSSLINDGNSVGTQIIESTVQGAPGSTWAFNNDGTGFLAVLISGTVTKLIQTANTDPVLQLGASGHNTQVLGTFESIGAATMDSTLTVTGDATFNGAGTGVTVTNNLLVKGSTSLDNGTFTTDGAGNISAMGHLTNNEAATTVNPSTGGSGTITVYQFLRGTYKQIFLCFNNWKNGTATVSISIPKPFITRTLWKTTNTPSLTLNNLGASVNPEQVTGFGTGSVQATADGWHWGTVRSGVDTIILPANDVPTFDGCFSMEGI